MSTQARSAAWRLVETPRCALEVRSVSSGPPEAVPALVIGTALTGDEMVPLASSPPLAGSRRIVTMRRRGYGASVGPVGAAPSVARDAEDVIALLDALGWERASLIGGSYSGAVVLEAASRAPSRIESVVAIEPPPLQSPAASEFRTACAELLAEHAAVGAQRAADLFLRRLMDRHWRLDLDRLMPGTAAAVDRDAAAFFERDLPALMGWRFTADDAARIHAPVLLINGSETAAWFTQEITALHDWIPSAVHSVIHGGDHSVAWTHPRVLATLIDGFLRGVW